MSAEARKAVLDGLRAAARAVSRPVPSRPAARSAPGPVPPLAFVGSMEAAGTVVLVARTRAAFARDLARIASEFGVESALVWNHPLLDGLDAAGTLDRAGVAVERPLPSEQGRSCRQADQVDLGVCAAEAVLAETGTLVMRAAPGCPRATALLPPVLVVVARAQDTLPDLRAFLPEAAAWRERFNPSGVFCVTGPSGTGDIEFVLVRGAHGPPTVIALVADF